MPKLFSASVFGRRQTCYGLAADDTELSLSDIADLCDVFYIGETKIGALCGEAVVFPKHNASRQFFTLIKQNGALPGENGRSALRNPSDHILGYHRGRRAGNYPLSEEKGWHIMNLREAAEYLNISKYPSILDETAAQNDTDHSSFCTEEMISSLQKEYNLFGEYAEDVLNGLRDLRKDPIRLFWASVVSHYIGNASCVDARNVPVPVSDGTPAGDMLPLLTLIPHVPASIETYRKRGLAEEEIRKLLETYKGSIATVHQRTGRPGINKTYYSWLCIYVKSMIFRYDGFNYEIKPMPGGTLILQNRFTGELAALPVQKNIHRDGLILGSAGCEDEQNSFTAVLAESLDGFSGNRAVCGKVQRETEYFPASDWECFLRPETYILNVHIPRGTDLSREKVLASFSGALEHAQKAYPEFHVKRVFCCSWLLDPSIGDLLDGKSRIADFGDMFERFPVSSAGKEVFSFVFTKKYDHYSDLPENTRLERALKRLYQEGGFVHAFAGVLKNVLL